MFNIAVVDDDVEYLQKICHLLEKSSYYDLFEIYRYHNPHKFIEEKGKTQFHLLLMDIGLQDEDGIQIVQSYYPDVPVIYITSYKNRMLQAFSKNTYKYILKDNIEDFFTKEFSDLMNQLLNNSLMKVFVDNEVHLVNVSDVLYIRYQKRNIYIHTDYHTYVMKKISLTSFIKKYHAYFIKSDRKTYINWKYIHNITKEKGVLLKDKETSFSISENRYSGFVKEYMDRSDGLWY